MIIIAGGEPELCHRRHAKREGGVYAPPYALRRGDGAGPAGTAAAGPMLEAKLMSLIKGRLQKF